MGATHFTTKRFRNVSTEMSLHVLAYDLKRVIKILGVDEGCEGVTALFSLPSRAVVTNVVGF